MAESARFSFSNCESARGRSRTQGPGGREEDPAVRAHCGVTQIRAAQISAAKSGGIGVTSESTDAAAIRRSLVDPAAFAAVFDRHFVAVHRYVHRRVGRDVADELAGETFRVAFEARARWSRMTPDARPWLLGIATNLLRRHLRTEQRRLRALARRGVDEWATPDENALAERADARQTRAGLAAALAALSPDDRDVLLLIAFGDLAYADVAQALGIPPGTVASRLNRARRVFTAELARPEEDRRG
jgi:RNA polymerase sigma factor (sigma-70 family)